jgi:catechol 2,3-dioxygenase
MTNPKGMQDHISHEQFKIHPNMKMGHVSLNVSDLDRSLEFYRSVLGFRTAGRVSDGRALLAGGEGSSHLVELHQVKDSSAGKSQNRLGASPMRAGLYHFAVLLPERRHLADVLQNLSDKRDQVYFDGLADHLVSESIYIRDPDFNGIEIYRDRPRSEWRRHGSQVEMATLPLDTADLLKETTEKGWQGMPVNTAIGHVHLHVSDIAKAERFYQEILGLQLTAGLPNASFFAADGYHHHVATNTWLGTGIARASPESIGLNHFSVVLPDKKEFTKLLGQFSRRNVKMTNSDSSDESVFVQDGDGIKILIRHD